MWHRDQNESNQKVTLLVTKVISHYPSKAKPKQKLTFISLHLPLENPSNHRVRRYFSTIQPRRRTSIFVPLSHQQFRSSFETLRSVTFKVHSFTCFDHANSPMLAFYLSLTCNSSLQFGNLSLKFIILPARIKGGI